MIMKKILIIFFILPALLWSQESNYDVFDMHSEIYVQAGYSKWNTTIPDDIQDFLYSYIKGLREGLNFTAGYRFLLKRKIFTGIEYSYFGTSNRLNNVQLVDEQGSVVAYGSIKDIIRINFFGVGGGMKFKINPKKLYFNISIYPGYYLYSDKQHIVIYDYDFKGQTIGYKIKSGFDILLSSNFSLGFQANYSGGKINKFKLDNEEYIPEKPENIERFDYNIKFAVIF